MADSNDATDEVTAKAAENSPTPGSISTLKPKPTYEQIKKREYNRSYKLKMQGRKESD